MAPFSPFSPSAAQLEALSPLAVLARGYSLTLMSDGATVLRSSDTVGPGDLIQTFLAGGAVLSRVESTTPGPDRSVALATPGPEPLDKNPSLTP